MKVKLAIGIFVLILIVCALRWPSKIYGHWELVELAGIEEAFEAEEARFAARGQEIIWETEIARARPFHITYRLNLLSYSTDVRYFGCNMSSSRYRGIIRKSVKDVRYITTELPTSRKCTSGVRKISTGHASENETKEIVQAGPAPINIIMATYLSAMGEDYEFRVSDDNRTLIFEDTDKNEIARFIRKGMDH